MIGLKTNLKNAEEIKSYITKKKLIDNDYENLKDSQNIMFPVKKKFKISKGEFIKADFQKRKKKKNLTDSLKEKLTKKELSLLKTAHDVVGTIAILEIPEELELKKKLIGESLLKINPNIKTILQKADEHAGIFRTQKMKWVAGEKTTETIHKENNIRLKLDVEKVYFSARLATERKRIMKQVKKGEHIMVLFSGCAPYPCVLSKNSEASEIWGIEFNPAGHKYAVENIRLNRLNNVKLIQGDVYKEVPKINKFFDRILMPLPKSAENFLPTALKISKKGTIIHFYDFLHETEFEKCEEKIMNACKKADLKYKTLCFVKCGQYSPGKFRVCLDFKIV